MAWLPFGMYCHIWGRLMAKRFIDTEIWMKEELLDSTLEQKLLFFYIITQCNNIGVFSISLRMVSFQVGFNVDEDMLLSSPMNIEKLDNGKFWPPKFCQHQYGELRESCKPHKRYMDDLKKEGLFDRVCIGYTKGIETLEEKEKEEEQDKDNDKVKIKKKKSDDYPNDFKEFWDNSMKTGSKHPASVAFKKAKGITTVEKLNEAIVNQIKHKHFTASDGKEFIPYITTWLNQRRWEDDVKVSESKLDEDGNILPF
jgi:hypothetical protein